MVMKNYSLCSLMYFVYYVVGVSGTEYPNKTTITKLRFHNRVNNSFFSQHHSDNLEALIMSVFCEAFLHNTLILLLQFS